MCQCHPFVCAVCIFPGLSINHTANWDHMSTTKHSACQRLSLGLAMDLSMTSPSSCISQQRERCFQIFLRVSVPCTQPSDSRYHNIPIIVVQHASHVEHHAMMHMVCIFSWIWPGLLRTNSLDACGMALTQSANSRMWYPPRILYRVYYHISCISMFSFGYLFFF